MCALIADPPWVFSFDHLKLANYFKLKCHTKVGDLQSYKILLFIYAYIYMQLLCIHVCVYIYAINIFNSY